MSVSVPSADIRVTTSLSRLPAHKHTKTTTRPVILTNPFKTHTHAHTHTHTHTNLTALCPDYRVSRYQKGTTNLDFTEARDSEWKWHQLGHMQVCKVEVKFFPYSLASVGPGADPGVGAYRQSARR